jgi:hypothetical protein
MAQHNHQTASTQFVYPRFGKTGGVLPLVFNQHFRGTMDYWDSAVTNGLAKSRELILFTNAEFRPVPALIQERGANVIAFMKALGLSPLFSRYAG